MPNWCENQLAITGQRLERDRFIGGFGTRTDDGVHPEFISRYIPMPDSIGDDWYNWCIDNWGTKWGDCNTRITKDDNDITVVIFDSAWGPPQQAIKTISGMFPSLTFLLQYHEPGMCFMGIDVYRNGTTLATWEVNSDGYPSTESVEDDAWEAQMEAVETMKELGQTIITAQLNFLKAVGRNA